MIVLYKGARGKGKTLTMVKDGYFAYLQGFRVISNFSLKFGDYMSNDEVLRLNRESNLRDCVLLLDELQLFFDSRNFGSKNNKDFSNFIQQIRKRNVHILATVQYQNTVELRFRQHIDVVAYPNFDKSIGYCKVYYFDISLLEDDLGDTEIKPNLVVYDAAGVFDLYDTTEMLK